MQNQPLNTDRLFDVAVMSFTRLVDKTSFLIIIGVAVLRKLLVRGGGLGATPLIT